MAVSDFDFNKGLIEAGVFACAYGYERVAGFPTPIPALTLVGKKPEGFERAFAHFARWGCERDGDTVDIDLLLKLDGTYEMWIGPEIERVMYRTVPQADLCRPMMLNVAWVKSFDSTHPAVRELKEYCKAAISPVVVTAARGDPTNPDITQIKTIANLPRLVKFNLRVVEEAESGDDPRFRVRDRPPDPRRSDPREPLSPEEYCWRRKRSLDVAFPVSRERVRRSGLVLRVRELPGFEQVVESQVVQAAINLMLSAELVPGDRHYSQVAGDLPGKIWSRVFSRTETANNDVRPADQEPTAVAQQLELDVRCVFLQHGVSTAGKTFGEVQALFRRNGYVDD